MPRTAVISQPRFLPALHYLHRMVLADVFVYLDTVQYSPRDWENRNRIKTAAGAQWLSVPVRRTGQRMLISEARVDNEQPWGARLLRTIRHHYSKAPYFDEYFPFFQSTFESSWEMLTDLNVCIIEYACRQFGISCEFRFASDLGVEGSGQELLMDICRAVGANRYLSGPLGGNYIVEEYWAQAGLELRWHEYEYPVYGQLHGDYLPWMCFLDLLMNCGRQGKALLERGYRGGGHLESPAPGTAV